MRSTRLACAALVVVVAGCGGGAHRHAVTVAKPPRAPVPRGSAPIRIRHEPLALPSLLPARSVRVPILMYHRIDVLRPTLPAITRRLTVAPADFAAQMAWLHANGFHAIRQEQLYAALFRGRPLPRKPVLVTFDDGYRDVLWNASPVLERLHMPATAYIITDRVSGPDPSFLTWGELRVLEQRGIEIGSHTVHHPDLPSLSLADARAELVDARRTLEQHLGHPVQWFAYPAGREDPAVVELARQAGYVLAVTTAPGTDQQAQEPLLLHRFEILDTTGVAGLAALLG